MFSVILIKSCLLLVTSQQLFAASPTRSPTKVPTVSPTSSPTSVSLVLHNCTGTSCSPSWCSTVSNSACTDSQAGQTVAVQSNLDQIGCRVCTQSSASMCSSSQLSSTLKTAYGLPTSGAVAVTVSGSPQYPSFSNTGTITYESCEVDFCSAHAGQGFDYHYHGDPFSPTAGKCMYSPADYGAATAHPPQIGYGLDGFLVYGRHLSTQNLGQTVALDDCGGHVHNDATGAAMPYHYHAQVKLMTGDSSAVSNGNGKSYYAYIGGIYQCFKGNISGVHFFNNDVQLMARPDFQYLQPCCGSTNYYAASAINIPGSTQPTLAPSAAPTAVNKPTPKPTVKPTVKPTAKPSPKPTAVPTGGTVAIPPGPPVPQAPQFGPPPAPPSGVSAAAVYDTRDVYEIHSFKEEANLTKSQCDKFLLIFKHVHDRHNTSSIHLPPDCDHLHEEYMKVATGKPSVKPTATPTGPSRKPTARPTTRPTLKPTKAPSAPKPTASSVGLVTAGAAFAGGLLLGGVGVFMYWKKQPSSTIGAKGSGERDSSSGSDLLASEVEMSTIGAAAEEVSVDCNRGGMNGISGAGSLIDGLFGGARDMQRVVSMSANYESSDGEDSTADHNL